MKTRTNARTMKRRDF